MSPGELTIISGGQTGVDRGALSAALAAGAPCGGWCPAGRRAEDGAIPAAYPLRELPGDGYAARTRRNVEDSDATLVILFPRAGAGTKLTMAHAKAQGKPMLVIDGGRESVASAIRQAAAFVRSRGIRRLNVGGPRAGEAPGAEDFARRLVGGLLARLGASVPSTDPASARPGRMVRP